MTDLATMTPQETAADDAFRHLPHLKGFLIPPEASKARVTPEVLAQWDEKVFALSGERHWRLSDAEREKGRLAVLQAHPISEDLWVFAYGSLMWDPGFHFAEVRHGELADHGRCFNYQVVAGRGTPAVPGLVLSLMPSLGTLCKGLVFRVSAEQIESETQILWRREMLRAGYNPQWHPLQTPQGPVRALVFMASPGESMYVHGLSMAQTAQRLAAAEGNLGKNRDYLHRLAEQLDCLGIPDPYVSQLHKQVAAL